MNAISKNTYKMIKFLLILLCSPSVLCTNILFLSSMSSPSHHIWNSLLALELVKKGHNVTLVDPNKDNKIKPNYTHILLEGVYDALQQHFDVNEMAKLGPLELLYGFEDWCIYGCINILKSEGLRSLLNYPPDFKFDLIMLDVTAGSCLHPVISRFNYPPSIAVTGFLLPSYVSYNFGNFFHPTYIPWYALPYTTNMDFTERVWNFLFTHLDVVLRYTREYRQEHNAAKEIFGQDLPPMEHFERHMSLVLTNIDPVLNYPESLAPNFISVGGLHTRKSNKLPEDLQTLLDNSENGVILFSLGTNIRSDKLDKRIQTALLNAFSKLSEVVIWKFESDIDNLPENVIVRKWLPQNDVLGHPKVKLFIGHGGALSTQEAIFHGVPMLCIPFIVDQLINTKMIVNKKLGVSLDYKQITEEYVSQKLKEVLENPEYLENMQKISSIFKDRMETPMERAVFWIEYVIRHKGAHFLSTAGRDFNYLKASGLDIIAFLLLILILALLIFYKLISLILRQFISKKKIKVN